MAVDLHLHTFHSDGSWSPSELVEQAIKAKLRYMAVTDHDTVAGVSEAVACAGDRIEVIPGIEINTVHYDESGRRTDVHVLGYFVDTDNSALAHVIERQQDARNKLVADTIDKMRSLGVEMTMEHVRACAGRGSIGRPHLTKAIVAAGGAETINRAWERFMSRTSPDFIARDSITPAEAVQGIVAAGGIASVAHPAKTPNIEAIMIELKVHGLRAVEAFHRSHGYKMVKHYIKFARDNDMLITGGSDCHGPAFGYRASIGTVKVPLDVVHKLKALQAAGVC